MGLLQIFNLTILGLCDFMKSLIDGLIDGFVKFCVVFERDCFLRRDDFALVLKLFLDSEEALIDLNFELFDCLLRVGSQKTSLVFLFGLGH